MGSERSDTGVSPGDLVAGKYRVTRVLGRGGMGVVVEAIHAKLGERVAVKLLHARYNDHAEATARFHHEARAAARMHGEHSVRLLDAGTAESGSPFFVMERLEGDDLGAVLRARRKSGAGGFPVEEAVLYILQACEGMAEVHANGIIHRDLKPGNLFLTQRPDGSPLVKLLDFGIAKSALPMEDTERAVTMTVAALGTPLYMSPEQVRCSKQVDARTDLWSLGAILYEMIAGKAAFGGNSTANIIAQVLEMNPPSIEAMPGVGPELDAVIRKVLEKKAEDRYADVVELAFALAPFGGEEGVGHAERAERLLYGEARSVAATSIRSLARAVPDSALSNPGVSSLAQRVGASPWRRRATFAVLGAASVGVLWAGAVVYEDVARPRIEAPATKGIGAASAVRGAVTRAIFRLSQEAPPAPAAQAPAASVQARPPLAPTPMKKAPIDDAAQDDLLSTRK